MQNYTFPFIGIRTVDECGKERIFINILKKSPLLPVENYQQKSILFREMNVKIAENQIKGLKMIEWRC